MITCQFIRQSQASVRCARCGRVVVSESPSVVAECRPGLGDMAASVLESVGITKRVVEAIVGGPCGCEERQQALNEWGRRTLGIGVQDAPERSG